jgi:hypothetical protein
LPPSSHPATNANLGWLFYGESKKLESIGSRFMKFLDVDSIPTAPDPWPISTLVVWNQHGETSTTPYFWLGLVSAKILGDFAALLHDSSPWKTISQLDRFHRFSARKARISA